VHYPPPAGVFIVDRQDAVAERQAARHRQVHQRPRGFLRHDLEMNSVAANDAAERDRQVIGLAVLCGRIERDRDGRRDFQRAGHGQDIIAHAGRLQLGGGAFEHCILDVVVEAGLHDQRPGAGDVGLVFERRAPCVCHGSVSIVTGDSP
jgi:hypothetical protein